MRKTILVVVFISLLWSSVSAAGLVPCGGPSESPCTLCDFFSMVVGVINFFLFRVVPVVGILFIVIAGANFILGSGYDPGLLQKAKDSLKAIAIGLLILYGSWVIINLFFQTIGLSGTGNWWQINCP